MLLVPVISAEYCLSTAVSLTYAVSSNGENGQNAQKHFVGITGEIRI
jgi:hypothetical protein